MKTETVLLIGQEAGNKRELFEAHADRLTRQTTIDEVELAIYEDELTVELRDQIRSIAADRVYVVPLSLAHTYDTIDYIPRVISYLSGEVRFCEPLGRSAAITEIILERAAAARPAGDNVSLVLVGFGSSSKPYHRQAVEYHASRIRDCTEYGEVVTCYLIQNPAVECVRYNVSKQHTVAVPLFLSQTEATERRIPEKLELSRGSIEYTTPLGNHPRITAAIHGEVEKQRALASHSASAPHEEQLNLTRYPIATDGEGKSS